MLRASLPMALVCLTGCSFAFNSGPPTNHQQLRYFDCNSSAAAPISDGFAAALHGTLAVSVVAADVEDGGDVAPLAFFGTVAALHAASAVYGVINAADCSDAKQHLAQRIHLQEARSEQTIAGLRQQLELERAKQVAGPTSMEPKAMPPELQADQVDASATSSAPEVETSPAKTP